MDHLAIYMNYMSLENFYNEVQCTYVWIDGKGNLRCKTRTLDFCPKSVKEIPEWTFGGCGTYQSETNYSDLLLTPVAMFKDPFRKGENKLILCEVFNLDDTPGLKNNRTSCNQVMELVKDQQPWFAIEQEFTLFTSKKQPLGWPEEGFPKPQGDFFNGIGVENVAGHLISEAHYKACLYAGIKIGGTNSEVMLGQWEYQIGPCEGILIGDHIWMSRFILQRVAMDFGVSVTFDPKPVPGWNGAGAHTNFSTMTMREKGGIKEIKNAIEKLELRHLEHIAVYDANEGQDNARRLTGVCETQHISKFSSGVADRGASIRIPFLVHRDGRGYLEDRRPAANSDPYLVAARIIRTVLLNE